MVARKSDLAIEFIQIGWIDIGICPDALGHLPVELLCLLWAVAFRRVLSNSTEAIVLPRKGLQKRPTEKAYAKGTGKRGTEERHREKKHREKKHREESHQEKHLSGKSA